MLTPNRSYYCFVRTLLLSKIEAITVDTLKVTHYETFSLRPDELDVSGSRFHDMCAFVAQSHRTILMKPCMPEIHVRILCSPCALP